MAPRRRVLTPASHRRRIIATPPRNNATIDAVRSQLSTCFSSWAPAGVTAGSAPCCSIPTSATTRLRARLLSIVPEEKLREDQSDLASWTRGDRKARFEQAAERHAGLNQFAAPFLSRMKFVDEQGEGASPTLAALRAYREHRAAGRRGVPPHAPLDFAPAALQPLIRHDGVTDRRRWESALFLKVHDEIQTANLAIEGAKNFGRFEALLPAHRAVGAGPRRVLGADRIPRRSRRGGRAAENSPVGSVRPLPGRCR